MNTLGTPVLLLATKEQTHCEVVEVPMFALAALWTRCDVGKPNFVFGCGQ